MAITIFAEAEIAWLFILAEVTGNLYSRPAKVAPNALLDHGIPLPILQTATVTAGPASDSLLQILLFFIKSSAFVFGSGLAIVPFLYKGVVQQFGWLNERQFLDAVAVAMITPGLWLSPWRS